MTDSTDMQQLRAWLAWATTETHVPARERAERRPDEMLITEAAAYLREHAGRGWEDDWDSTVDTAGCIEHHPAAFRDLVLAWAAAVEAMRAAVPEAAISPGSVVALSAPVTGTTRPARDAATGSTLTLRRSPAAAEWERMMREAAARVAQVVGVAPCHVELQEYRVAPEPVDDALHRLY